MATFFVVSFNIYQQQLVWNTIEKLRQKCEKYNVVAFFQEVPDGINNLLKKHPGEIYNRISGAERDLRYPRHSFYYEPSLLNL